MANEQAPNDDHSDILDKESYDGNSSRTGQTEIRYWCAGLAQYASEKAAKAIWIYTLSKRFRGQFGTLTAQDIIEGLEKLLKKAIEKRRRLNAIEAMPDEQRLKMSADEWLNLETEKQELYDLLHQGSYWTAALMNNLITVSTKKKDDWRRVSLEREMPFDDDSGMPLTLHDRLGDSRYDPARLVEAAEAERQLLEFLGDSSYAPAGLAEATRTGRRLRNRIILVRTIQEYIADKLDRAKNAPDLVVPACVALRFGLGVAVVCDSRLFRSLTRAEAPLKEWLAFAIHTHGEQLTSNDVHDAICINREIQITYPKLSRRLDTWRVNMQKQTLDRGKVVGTVKDNFRADAQNELTSELLLILYGVSIPDQLDSETNKKFDADFKAAFRWLTGTYTGEK